MTVFKTKQSKQYFVATLVLILLFIPLWLTLGFIKAILAIPIFLFASYVGQILNEKLQEWVEKDERTDL